jgi:hypothetical protein
MADDFSWAMDMTEEALTGIFAADITSGSQTVAMLLQLREALRSIPQLHGTFAEKLTKAITALDVTLTRRVSPHAVALPEDAAEWSLSKRLEWGRMAESALRCFNEMLGEPAFEIEIYTIDDLHERVKWDLGDDGFDLDLANDVFDFLRDAFKAAVLSSGIMLEATSNHSHGGIMLVVGKPAAQPESALSSLLHACRKLDLQLVTCLFERYMDRFENPRVKSAALIAVASIPILEMLAQDRERRQVGLQIIRLLVEQGGDLNNWSCPLLVWLANQECPDPMDTVCAYGSVDFWQYLENKGFNICNAAPFGSRRRYEWVCSAIEHGNINIVEAFHAQYGFDMDLTSHGKDALVEACIWTCPPVKLPIIKYLHETARLPLTGKCMRALADSGDCIDSLLEIIKYLHFAGLDVGTHKDSANWLTAFCHNWPEIDAPKVVDFFAEQGADLCQPDDDGRTPLHAAWINHSDGWHAMDGDSEVIARLCCHSRDISTLVSKYTKARWHGLHLACHLGQEDEVRGVLGCTALEEEEMVEHLHQGDAQGKTCCHLAAGAGSIPILALLRGEGANLCHRGHTDSAYGWTPSHEACENGQLECMRYLQNNGYGDPSDSVFMLKLAIFCGHLEIVKYLVGSDSTLLPYGDALIAKAAAHEIAIRRGASTRVMDTVGAESCAEWIRTTSKARQKEESSKGRAAMAAAMAAAEAKAQAIAQALIEEEDQEKAKADAKSKKRKGKKRTKQLGENQPGQTGQAGNGRFVQEHHPAQAAFGSPERLTAAFGSPERLTAAFGSPEGLTAAMDPPSTEPSPLERAASDQDPPLQVARQCQLQVARQCPAREPV